MNHKTQSRSFIGQINSGVLAVLLASASAQCYAAEEGIKDQMTLNKEQAQLLKAEPMENVLRYGAFDVRPYFLGSVLYDDNIRIRSTNHQKDAVWNLSPGLLLGAGEYRTSEGTFAVIDYRPDIILYTDHSEFDSVNHEVSLQAQRNWSKLTLAVGQAYEAGTGGATEALNRVRRSIYITTVRGIYDYSEKTSFEVDGKQNISDYDQLISYDEWVSQVWVNYQVTPKINTGLGGAIGFRDITANPNQTYEQGLIRGIYALTEKVKVNASVGAEFQQYQDGGSRGPTMVFNVGALYKPLEQTTISLEGYRRDQNSVVLANQNYTATGFRASGRQQLFVKYFASLTGGYEIADYHAVGATSLPDREDKYFYVGPALDYYVTDRLAFGVFYQYRKNNSTLAGFDFDNNQAGLRGSYRF